MHLNAPGDEISLAAVRHRDQRRSINEIKYPQSILGLSPRAQEMVADAHRVFLLLRGIVRWPCAFPTAFFKRTWPASWRTRELLEGSECGKALRLDASITGVLRRHWLHHNVANPYALSQVWMSG